MSGWVKLHRQFLTWEWYDDMNVTRLFLHLILKANHKEKKYKGAVIKRGQLLTGRELLSNETGLSQQQIRTCLTKLKSTSDITIKSTSKGTLVTVNNYGLYQSADNEVTSKSTSTPTNEQPTSNQQVTTNKNDKKEKKEDISQLIVDEFNERLPELGRVKVLSDKRKSWIRGAIKQMEKTENDFSSIDTWVRYFDYVSGVDFLMGRKTDFAASFDFLVNKNNLLKVVEGNYDN